MGILDDALNSQEAKRSQRLSKEARKSKIDSNKIKEGTYRGIDLVDGTAKIQLDGQTNTTSGYKLITNAPLGDGDRVSIRPNGIGMPRADAKNVAPKIAPSTQKLLPDVAAQIKYISYWIYSTYGYSSLPKVFAQLDIEASSGGVAGNQILKASILDYIYDGSKIQYKNKSKLSDLSAIVMRVTEDTTNPSYVVGMNQSLCSFAANFAAVDGVDLNQFIIRLNKPLPIYPDPWIAPVNSAGLLASPSYGSLVQLEMFFLEKEFEKKLKDVATGSFTESASPFDFEIIINGVLVIPDPLYPSARPVNFIYSTASPTGKGWYLSYFNMPAIPPNLTEYTMSFRFRKRVTSGDPLPWFSLG